ncbi:A-kinase anchor protein 11 [Bagarius yarrelli]|uniref:A-kinase anchor protein 11 n=1 Tax=Bagarius yarrelli TaxID=175774 RepID=A0A556U691_BAGYA|nr:A-kinase anchor protein 11 [Bagarius yarrelli]
MDYIDPNAPGPKPVHTDAVHQFAKMLSEDIVDAAVRKQDTHFIKDSDQICNLTQSGVRKCTLSDQEMLANSLTAKIYNNALEELARSGCSAGKISEEHSDVLQTYENAELSSYHYSTVHYCDHDVPATEKDDIYQRRYSTSPTPLDSMAHVGSLDYPDAPPTTPLLPEMLNSRASFTRKLKAVLAKEFLPSTPPPTPKDQPSLKEDKLTDSTADKSEFVVWLMSSLSLACSQLGEDNDNENGARFQSKISDFAAQLSAEIIHCVTDAGCNKSLVDLQVLANHLAKDIIRISIAEVMRWKNRKSQEGSSHLENMTQEMSDTILSDPIPNIHPVEALEALAGRLVSNTLLQALSELGSGYLENTSQTLIRDISSQESPTYLENTTQYLSDPISDIPSVEALRAMAGGLITNTLVQVVSEPGSGSLQHATSHQLPDLSSEIVPWKKLNDQCLQMSFCIPHQPRTNGWSNMKSESSCNPFDPTTGTVEDVFTENIVHELLKCSIREASNHHLRCKEKSFNSNRLNSSVEPQPVIRAFISETSCHDTQELQCLLLWAAASQTGSSTLQIDLTNKHIQQQLCSISLQSQVHSWTVGYLMTSLVKYCEDLQIASRGQSKIYTSLLGQLLLT